MQEQTKSEKDISDRWSEYLKNTANKPPRRLVKRFVNYLNSYDPRIAGAIVVDMGCGAGNDTCYYAVNSNYKITALDSNNQAIEVTMQAAKSNGFKNVSSVTSDVTKQPIPECDVASASYFLPFIPPTLFTQVWQDNIVAKIKPGGYFVGHFFGPDHAWSKCPDLIFMSKEEVSALFDKDRSSFEGLKFFKETKREVKRADGSTSFFHTFKVVARKKGGAPLKLNAEQEENVRNDFFKKPF